MSEFLGLNAHSVFRYALLHTQTGRGALVDLVRRMESFGAELARTGSAGHARQLPTMRSFIIFWRFYLWSRNGGSHAFLPTTFSRQLPRGDKVNSRIILRVDSQQLRVEANADLCLSPHLSFYLRENPRVG